jgi:hypothetical protein
MKKHFFRKALRDYAGQSGQALILVLVFVLLGSLTVVPVMAHMSTALKTGVTYENKSRELYTADAGIENGLWRIKYDSLGPTYQIYDYSTTWDYATDLVNGKTAAVSVQNVWLPTNVTLPALGISADQAQQLNDSEKLVITGSSGAVPGQPYHIKMEFVPVTGDNLTIKSIGIWLPQGFTYTTGSSTLEQASIFSSIHPDATSISPTPGGTAVVWHYDNDSTYPVFTDFPNYTSDNGTETATFQFSYTPPASNPTLLPVATAWMTCLMKDSSGNPVFNPNDISNVPIAWDTDTRYYKITSASGNTEIESYSSKSQLRKLGDAISGDYVAIGNSLMTGGSYPDYVKSTLLASSSTNVSAVSPIPNDADVISAILYWSGFRLDQSPWGDNCTSSNLTNWQNGGDWAYDSSGNKFYKGQHSGADSRRSLAMGSGVDFSAYPPGTTFEIGWQQAAAALSDIFSDTCSSSGLSNNWQAGTDWSYDNTGGKFYKAEHSGSSNSTALLTLKNGQPLNGYSSVSVSWDQWKTGTLNSSDILYFFLSSDNGSTWSSSFTAGSSANLTGSAVNMIYSIPSQYLTSGFEIRFYIAGFGSGKYCCLDNIKITPAYTSADGLDYALSSNGGATWSGNFQAFRGDIGSTMVNFSCDVTAQYNTAANFRIKFSLVGMGGAQQYADIDSMKITVRPPDNSISFLINGQQVYLDSNNNPQAGSQPLTTTSGAVLINSGYSGFSYACHKDVSKLVKTYPIVPGEQHHTGNANYTVGAVAGDTGQYVSYAGWSLIIIYSSPETAGHYLYLRDIFDYEPGNVDLDFDGDGAAGGDITGFVIPEPIKDKYGNIIETVAASLTCFVGEGDVGYTGDSVQITGQQSGLHEYLSNSASPWNNVWNSASPGCSYAGIDVDTFQVLWSDNILTPADTRIHLDLNSGQDCWNLVYLILSVRSETVTSGTEHFVIHANN